MRQERRRALLFPVLARNIEASRAEARGRRHELRVGQSVTREFGSVQATHARQIDLGFRNADRALAFPCTAAGSAGGRLIKPLILL